MSATVAGKNLEFTKLLGLLSASVTEFDCGELCAPGNGGIPVCCENDRVIPVLYQGELRVLLERSDLWRRWRPETASDRRLEREMSRYCLGTCKGPQSCERENRSLNCRTFPFVPYFDHDDRLVGIIYDHDSAAGKCPLVGRPEAITARYIAESMVFWAALVEADAGEALFFRDESARERRRCGRLRQDVKVLVPEGIRYFPTAKHRWMRLEREGRRPTLEPMVRPRG